MKLVHICNYSPWNSKKPQKIPHSTGLVSKRVCCNTSQHLDSPSNPVLKHICRAECTSVSHATRRTYISEQYYQLFNGWMNCNWIHTIMHHNSKDLMTLALSQLGMKNKYTTQSSSKSSNRHLKRILTIWAIPGHADCTESNLSKRKLAVYDVSKQATPQPINISICKTQRKLNFCFISLPYGKYFVYISTMQCRAIVPHFRKIWRVDKTSKSCATCNTI